MNLPPILTACLTCVPVKSAVIESSGGQLQDGVHADIARLVAPARRAGPLSRTASDSSSSGAGSFCCGAHVLDQLLGSFYAGVLRFQQAVDIRWKLFR